MLASSVLGVAAFAADDHIGDKGSLEILNYNVAGLPIPNGVGSQNSSVFLNQIEIGYYLNKSNADVIALQEDFNFDQYLRDEMTNYANVTGEDGEVIRYQSENSALIPLSDGLNIFSKYPLYNVLRFEWDESMDSFQREDAGSIEGDSLTSKGFMVATIEPIEGYYVDIYDLHADAFGGQSYLVKQKQFTQLAKFVMKHSVYDPKTATYDHAVIVTGDFNCMIFDYGKTEDSGLLTNLIDTAKLNDAWAVQNIDGIDENVSDPEFDYASYYDYANRTDIGWNAAEQHYDPIERVLYASGNGIKLTSGMDYTLNFFYASAEPERSLSDHPYATVTLNFEIVEKVQDDYHQHDDIQTETEHSFLITFLSFIGRILRTIGNLLRLPGLQEAADNLLNR